MSGVATVLVVVIGVAAAVAVLLGLSLVVAPLATLRASGWFGWHDPLGRLARWVDERRYVERYVYRHHRWFGAAIGVGALAVSYRLLHPATRAAASAPFHDLILLGAVRFLWTANTLFVIVGVIVFVRPSLLKGFEKWANRWVSVPSPRGVDQVFQMAPRMAGTFLAITGIYLASLMLIG